MRLTVRITSAASPESRLLRLAPPSASSPLPREAAPRSAAQSAGAEQVMMRPLSFSTQRNAGMSALEPSSRPACEAPVCDERSVSHSESVCEPSRPSAPSPARARRAWHAAARAGPARRSPGRRCRALGHGARRERRAMRCVTRSEDVVVVGAQQHLEHDRDGSRDQRDEQRREEVVDREGLVRELGGDPDHPRVEQQDQKEADGEHVRQAKRRDERRDQALSTAMSAAAQNPHQPLDLDAGHDDRRDVQREALVTHWSSTRRSRILGRPGAQCGIAPYLLA